MSQRIEADRGGPAIGQQQENLRFAPRQAVTLVEQNLQHLFRLHVPDELLAARIAHRLYGVSSGILVIEEDVVHGQKELTEHHQGGDTRDDAPRDLVGQESVGKIGNLVDQEEGSEQARPSRRRVGRLPGNNE